MQALAEKEMTFLEKLDRLQYLVSYYRLHLLTVRSPRARNTIALKIQEWEAQLHHMNQAAAA